MPFPTTTTSSKHVSWASPLIECPVHHLPVRLSSSTIKERKTPETLPIFRTAIESLRYILRKYPASPRRPKPVSRHDSLDVSSSVVTSTLTAQKEETFANQDQIRARYEAREKAERERYEHRRYEYEQMLLGRDGFYEDRSREYRWTASCKFVDILASRDIDSKPDYFFSKSDLLVSLFINADLVLHESDVLAGGLMKQLIHDFPHVKKFRFAVFFPRQLVEEKSEVPMALRYLIGTSEYMHRTASFGGATTEMERKFITRQHHRMRRARYDHVEIHENSLHEGYLVAKVDPEDTYHVLNLSQESSGSLGTRPINIVRPKGEDVDCAWEAPEGSSVWA